MKRTNAEICREQYAKHREKRLAAKREEYRSDPDKVRERNRAQYAANKDKRVEYAREYRRRNREKILAQKAEEWRTKSALIKERRKRHNIDLQNRRAYAREYLKRNPDRALLMAAKRSISEKAGIAIRDVPDDLAQAEAEYLLLVRWLREQTIQNRSPNRERENRPRKSENSEGGILKSG